MASYYELLGVPSTSSEAEIKSAYHAKMKKFHPDMQHVQNDSTAKNLNEAYRVLSNPDRRLFYDRTLAAEMKSKSSWLPPTKPIIRTSPPTKPQPASPTFAQGNKERCWRCDGYGYNLTFGIDTSCDYCKGRGWIPARKF